MRRLYIFSNVIGIFIFNEQFQIFDKYLFVNSEQYKNKDSIEKRFYKKYPGLKKPTKDGIKKILAFFKNKNFFEEFHKKNILITKKMIKDSINEDLLIIQAVSAIEELEKSINILMKRLREWYGLYAPESEHYLQDQERFLKCVLGEYKEEIPSVMGANFSERDLMPIIKLAEEIKRLYELKSKNELYLEGMMESYCPNLVSIAGVKIGAKLIKHSGSLKRLVESPASKIQLLGAEKALFRHIRTGSKAPKHGYIFQHPLIVNAPKELHGKIARTIADKIALAVRIDYFRGKFVGNKLRKELEERVKKEELRVKK